MQDYVSHFCSKKSNGLLLQMVLVLVLDKTNFCPGQKSRLCLFILVHRTRNAWAYVIHECLLQNIRLHH